MSTKLAALLDIAATIIPALRSLAGEDKTGKLANDIAEVIKDIAKEDDAEQIKAKIEKEPAVKTELEQKLAEIANQKAKEENRALEEMRRLELKEEQKKLENRERQHEDEIEIIKKNLESTNAARGFAQNTATSEKWWISSINSILSIIIIVSFLSFVYLLSWKPIGLWDSKNGDTKTDIVQRADNAAPPPTDTADTGDRQGANDEGSGDEKVTEPNPAGANAKGNKTNTESGKAGLGSKDVFLVAFGALATAFATVIGFHFGSSSGSKRKTQLQRIYGTRGTSTPPAPGRGGSPQVPGSPAPGRKEEEAGQATHPFEAFWLKNLSHIEHFNWEELLFKGASNSRYKSNTDPDPNLYPNVVPLVNLLEKVRKEIDAPVKLISIYRSPEYNRDVGGATASRHMQFDAADFRVLGSGVGNSNKWYKIAEKLRNDGEFKGGIGVYATFVHVDTRGTNAFWDNR